jgi:hypothetical protein
MAEMGKYIYCIIPCSENRTFDADAIGDGGGAVHTVPHNGLAAVVSDSPVTQYESTRQNMMAHEKAIERVMKEFTLLPVRFGTVTDSTSPAQDIQKLLRSRFEEFQKLLKDMEGKVELGLKAFWRDQKAIFEEIVAENAHIRKLRNSLSGESPETTHFDRIRLGEMVKEALNRKRAKEAAKILQPLGQLAQRIRENEALGDRMVVNAAFLVNKSKEPEFDEVVSKLDEQFVERVAIKYIGSAPPYNFVNIMVDWKELS